MKWISHILSLFVILYLVGCTTSSRFDATDESSIKHSTENMLTELETIERTEFETAVMYFKLGDQWRLLLNNPDDQEPDAVQNVQVIDGLTAEEILEKYRAEIGKGLGTPGSTK
jgi:hypothetical protein